MERIGEYLIKRMVGEGGMGKVYEAEERLSKRRVALKVLRPELTRSEDGRRLFLNEMTILAHLEHPNVVRSLASMEVDDQLVMVLEFLQGRTLREELVKRGSLPWHEAVEIAAKMADALHAAHTQSPTIIHRDLKPENVMLTDDGGLKVMDFGIAKVLQEVHATNTQSIGTLQYMSPEQIDAHTIDARSDLYALGLILYEMLTGKPPFHSASPRELLNMQCTEAPPPLSDEVVRTMPAGVEDLLFSLLEKSPGDRPASATEVIAALTPFRPAERRGRRSTTANTTHTTSTTNTTNTSSLTSGRPKVVDETPDAPKNDTLLSTPHRDKMKKPREEAEKPARVDTIALVEREGRDIPTGKALLVILGLSVFAGLATYMIRSHSRSVAEPPATATATATTTTGAR